MNAKPSEIVAAFLVRENIADRPAANAVWPIFDDFIPDEPNDVICCYNVDPVLDGKTMAGEMLRHPQIQIRVRCYKSDDGWAKIIQILESLMAARREAITALVQNGAATEDIILKSALLTDGPRSWIASEENKRRQTYSMTVQITASEAP